MRLKSLLLFLAALLVAAFVPAARAQFIGYSSPQTVSVQAFNAVTVPTTKVVQNLGQSIHLLTYSVTFSSSPCSLDIRLEASQDGTNWFPISADGTESGASGASQVFGLFASGYFPLVRANLVEFSGPCTAASVTAFYSGTSTANGPPFGAFVQNTGNRIAVTMGNSILNGTIAVNYVPLPSGTTAGTIYFSWMAAGAAGVTSIKGVACTDRAHCGTADLINATVNNAGAIGFPQPFGVLPTLANGLLVTTSCSGAPCSANTLFDEQMQIANVSGGLGISASQSNPAIFTYSNITTNTTTQVKSVAGFLHSLTINTSGTTDTATIFDNTSCAGTKIGTVNSAAVPVTLFFDVQFSTGLCVLTAGTTPGDLTVSWR